mgnify:CR=1 FL=1
MQHRPSRRQRVGCGTGRRCDDQTVGPLIGNEVTIDIDTQFQGLKGFFTGESLFFLKITGSGPLLIASYGGIEEITVSGSLLVDTGHIVAFQEGLTYQVQRLGGWKSFFMGGEGLVSKFSGNGKLWVQSRNVAALTGCVSGAASVETIRALLRVVGFENIRVDVKEQSREFIREWLPGSGVENYVASATSEAVKPVGAKSCCGPSWCAPETSA